MRCTFRLAPFLELAGVALALVIASAAPSTAQAPKRIALVGGQLLTGYEVPPIHHAVVLVEGDKIVAAGPAAAIKIPTDAVVVDTSGRTMMPGLIEAHAHLITLGHGNYATWFPWINAHGGEQKLLQVMEAAAKELLWAGVTTAVDLGAPLQPSVTIRDRINRGQIPGPHMLISGPWIARLSPEAAKGAMQVGFGGLNIASSDQAAAETERLALAGVDAIKAHAGLTLDDYKAIVRVAHQHRIRVHAHVYAEADVRHALESDVDVLQHAGSAGTAPPYSAEMIRDIVNAGRPVVVTAAHRSWVFPDTVAFPERLQDPQLRADFGPEIYAEVQRSFENFQGLSYMSRVDREVSFRERGLGQFIESGAILGMGTDSGTPLNFHTEALWREIKAHVDLGMSPRRAIMAATRINARILGRNDLGTLEAGKLADLIVVNGDPLFDIQALGRVEIVVKGGVIFKGDPATAPAR